MHVNVPIRIHVHVLNVKKGFDEYKDRLGRLTEHAQESKRNILISGDYGYESGGGFD